MSYGHGCHLPSRICLDPEDYEVLLIVAGMALYTQFGITEVTAPNARCFYGFQIAVKNIHSQTLSLLVYTYIKDPMEKSHLLHAIETVLCVQCKANWDLKWCNPTKASFSKRMIAFATVEGISFSVPFCTIFWLKTHGLMPGLSFSNKLISLAGNVGIFVCRLHPPNDRHLCLLPTCRQCRPNTLVTF